MTPPESQQSLPPLRRWITLAFISIFAASQVVLVYLGWRTAIDGLRLIYPESVSFLEFWRHYGVVYGLAWLVAPFYFGVYRLGLQCRAPHDRASSQSKRDE